MLAVLAVFGLLNGCSDGVDDPVDSADVGTDVLGDETGVDGGPLDVDSMDADREDTAPGDTLDGGQDVPSDSDGDATDVDDDSDAVESDVPDADVDEWEPRCSERPSERSVPTGPVPPPASPKAGVDEFEVDAFERLRDHVLEDPGVFFIATLDRRTEQYVIEAGPEAERMRLVFERAPYDSGREFDVVEGSVDAMFGCTSPDAYLVLSELLAEFENLGFERTDIGYEEGDPRVGTLPSSGQCYPYPLERIAVLFDAPDSPDAVATLHPWAHPAPSTHGGLGLLQSRSTLILSGAGTRRGTVVERAARLPDVVPTVLAALGSETTDGYAPDGYHSGGLHLLRQDGEVLWDALAEDSCDRARYAVILLFDGLMANEINEQVTSDTPDVDLPNFRALAADGVVFAGGAVTNFPSVSAPGHMSAGSGVWSGHHGILGNAFYGRAERQVINPYDLINDPAYFILHPEEITALYERAVSTDFETLAQAAHRGIGPWDEETGEGAYTVVINEVSIGGADRTTFDSIGGAKAGIEQYRLADELAVVQVEGLLRDLRFPVPTTLQVSFVATDAAGEATGPHSELVRSELETADRHIGGIINAYRSAGAFEDTMFVIVSDHGMELQDPTRSSNFNTLASGSGVRLTYSGSGLIYFKSLGVIASPMDDGRLQVTVTDHDDDAPVSGAVVRCETCTPTEQATDDDGHTVFAPGGEDSFFVTAPGYNDQALTLE